MSTVRIPIPTKSKALGCMYSVIRETISVFGAFFVFFFMALPLFIKDILDGSEKSWLWVLAIAVSFGTYFGIRRLFNFLRSSFSSRTVSVELPEDLPEENFTAFLVACAESLALLRKDAQAINKLSLQRSVLYLCQLGDELLVNFEKDPRDVQAARALPDRLHRLHQVISGYPELADQRTPSPQTVRALRDTENAVTKAVIKFEQLHHRLLENNAMDLSTSAKTLNNLLDFD